VEALIKILEAAFRDPNEVGMASPNWIDSPKVTINSAFIMQNFNDLWQSWNTILSPKRPPLKEVYPRNFNPVWYTSLMNPRIS
jgi:hypothetical protein